MLVCGEGDVSVAQVPQHLMATWSRLLCCPWRCSSLPQKQL